MAMDHIYSMTVKLFGAQADFLIVSARTAGNQTDPDGISLFVVPAGADGSATPPPRPRGRTRRRPLRWRPRPGAGP